MKEMFSKADKELAQSRQINKAVRRFDKDKKTVAKTDKEERLA